MARELLFSGQLLALAVNEPIATRMHPNKEAFSFLQRLLEPLTVVSFHGLKTSGKTALIQSLLGLDEAKETDGVWLYIQRLDYANAKYLAVLDRPDYGEDKQLDALLYHILGGLSSVVVHHISGLLTADAIDPFAFLAPNVEVNDTPPADGFPQSPTLLWVLQDVTTKKLKEQVQESGLSLQKTEQTYLCNALAALPHDSPSARASMFLESAFSDQRCFIISQKGTEAFEKRVEKLMRVFTASIHNQYFDNVVLNGPLLGSIMVSMLAHTDNVFMTFESKLWQTIVHDCCLNIVENGVKLYKLRMFERLGNIVDISDLKEFQPALSTLQEHTEAIELPCESDVLNEVHDLAKREAKATLHFMNLQSKSLGTLLKKLYRELVQSLFATIQEKNNRISAKCCQSLLATLHTKMTKKVDALLQGGDDYTFQSTEFKRFYHQYQAYLFELMAEYTDQAKGSVKRQEFAKFMHNTIRPQLAEYSIKLDKLRQHDTELIERIIIKKEKEIENFRTKQKSYQIETGDAQDNVDRQLVHVAKLQALRKDALAGAIIDLTKMHTMATKQKELLEEAAFVSVQLPEQKVIEAAQEKEVTELQGYLIKQGGGGNVLNPLGRKNWKQRYFILIGVNLVYAKSKDDYERGKIIKELCLTGCKIDPSRDAGEGFDITPGKSAHVFELQRGLFEKNSKKRSSAADSGRVFKLRTQNIQERDMWMYKLRQAAGGY